MSGKMVAIITKAEEAGYAGVAANSGRSFKQYGCANCRKNTAVKLVHTLYAKAYLACICGWRKRTSV